MVDVVIETLLGMTAVLAVISCIVIIYLKMYYHYRYLKLLNGNGDGSGFISDIPLIVAPIIIRNKDQEKSNQELAKIGIRIKRLLVVFFSLFFYFLIITQMM